jgi:hypothetical protein
MKIVTNIRCGQIASYLITMEALNQTGLGRIYKMDRCRKYLPRYDEKTFL